MIPAELDSVLHRHGLTWPQLQRASAAIFLFGSRAAGCAREDSDWDLLCIGDGPSRMRHGLDLLWIPAQQAKNPQWRSTELASHVAAWGRCLHGDPHWVQGAAPGAHAARRKAGMLDGRVRALPRDRPWPSERLRSQRIQQIRRDLQRFALLADGIAVPPSGQLDTRWQDPAERERVFLVAREAGWSVLVRLIEGVADPLEPHLPLQLRPLADAPAAG